MYHFTSLITSLSSSLLTIITDVIVERERWSSAAGAVTIVHVTGRWRRGGIGRNRLGFWMDEVSIIRLMDKTIYSWEECCRRNRRDRIVVPLPNLMVLGSQDSAVIGFQVLNSISIGTTLDTRNSGGHRRPHGTNIPGYGKSRLLSFIPRDSQK